MCPTANALNSTTDLFSSREERFAADFPGRIARFSDGHREIIIRWVARETRALHSASDCFKGLGYWTDVSSWYWQATMSKTSGGWWAVTVAERQ
jgi:hypothetical protein